MKLINKCQLKVGDFFNFEQHPKEDIFLVISNEGNGEFIRLPNKFSRDVLKGTKLDWNLLEAPKLVYKLSKAQVVERIRVNK